MNNPTFPAKLYLFDETGKYHKDKVVTITDEKHLNSPAVQTMIVAHIKSGLEVRMTDPNDFCLFHADKGKIIFPPPLDERAALAVGFARWQ